MQRLYCTTMLTSLGARMITLATSRPPRARTTDSSAIATERRSSSLISGEYLQPATDLALDLNHTGH